jgi:hypothetical protein
MVFGALVRERKQVKMVISHPKYQFEEVTGINFDNPGRQKITLKPIGIRGHDLSDFTIYIETILV